MRDLNRYVTKKYATDWYDIGIELGLELDLLDIIKKENPQQSVTCFQKTLDKWLKLNSDDATWKTLEVALTNVNRTNLRLDPVDNIHGQQLYREQQRKPFKELKFIAIREMSCTPKLDISNMHFV